MIAFEPGSILWNLWRRVAPLRMHYRRTFDRGEDREVLLDLAKYCHALSETTNEREQGRRDVWLRICRFTRLTEDELTIMTAELTPERRYQLYNPGPTFIEAEN
jgi:hypothetical protein